MATSKKGLAETVFGVLDEETFEHFKYNKLFLNGINSKDKDEVTKFLENEYLGGKSPEEFALAYIQDGIAKDMGKFVVKKKDVKENEKSSAPEKKSGAAAS